MLRIYEFLHVSSVKIIVYQSYQSVFLPLLLEVRPPGRGKGQWE